MRFAPLFFVFLLALAGCQSDIAVSPPEQQRTLFQPEPLGSFVRMNQTNAKDYFVSGIYDLEADAWRWTGKRAVLRVRLKDTEDLKYVMKLAVPGTVVERYGPVKLGIQLNGKPWEQVRYEKDGVYEWEKAVPAELLKPDSENVLAIETDKVLPAEKGGRELGFILVWAGLQPLPWKP